MPYWQGGAHIQRWTLTEGQSRFLTSDGKAGPSVLIASVKVVPTILRCDLLLYQKT